jgi:hypothetical protein
MKDDNLRRGEAGHGKERRNNRRLCPAKARWLADDRDFNVEVLSISDNGAALRAEDALPTGGKGRLAISDIDPRKAEIRRVDKKEHCFYIHYLDEAA